MKFIECWKEEGVTIPAPYHRNIKCLFAPDKEDVAECMFTHAIIYPHSSTDYHRHDRPELIYIVSGRGKAVCEGEEREITADCAMWIPAGEMHQMINTGDETLKLATFFIPGYLANENYNRCLEAARAANAGQS